MQIRQGTMISIGMQVSLQVFWPPSPLYKSSNEEIDNGLIMRLVSPGVSMLLLGATALSKYALMALPGAITSDYLRANIVQVVAEVGKSMPSGLNTILQVIRPSLLIVTPAAVTPKKV